MTGGAVTGDAVTWWGHAAATVELGGVRVALDPLLVGRLFHLRRRGPLPPPAAAQADIVLVSHLHADHLHVPSLARFDTRVPLLLPRGAGAAVRGLSRLPGRPVHEVAPGDVVEIAGVRVTVREAHHDGRRLPVGRPAPTPPALGFVVEAGGRSCWYPGDTGEFAGLTAGLRPGATDLAVVPIGGWGPSLGEHHLEPEQAAAAAARVAATTTLAVHYGTFWPVGLERVHPGSHERYFTSPPARFRDAAGRLGLTGVVTPGFGQRVRLT